MLTPPFPDPPGVSGERKTFWLYRLLGMLGLRYTTRPLLSGSSSHGYMIVASSRGSPGSYDCSSSGDGLLKPQPRFGVPRTPWISAYWLPAPPCSSATACTSKMDSSLFSPSRVN